MTIAPAAGAVRLQGPLAAVCGIAVAARWSGRRNSQSSRRISWASRVGDGSVYSGAALSPRALEIFEASEATTITTAIRPTTSVQMALISGFTPSRTSE